LVLLGKALPTVDIIDSNQNASHANTYDLPRIFDNFPGKEDKKIVIIPQV